MPHRHPELIKHVRIAFINGLDSSMYATNAAALPSLTQFGKVCCIQS